MSNIKPIKTEASYKSAMSEIERLWGSKLGTPAGDRPDVLATLVEVYEMEHFPVDLPGPSRRRRVA